MKIIVLGASGMLGNAVYRALFDVAEVYGTMRSHLISEKFSFGVRERILTGIDVEIFDVLEHMFATIKPHIVINCVGVVKQIASANDPLLVLPINSIFPHRLAKLCKLVEARLIHISTDCVFEGTVGNYDEDSISDARDLYGKSKYLGEVSYPHTITLRTSIVGHGLSGSHGLIDWFLAQEGRVNGYTRAIFSGLPTVGLAEIIRYIALSRSDLTGLYHIASAPISKYNLLELVADVYSKNIEIVPDDSLVVDRSLNADKFYKATGYVAPSWPELVRRMFKFR